MIRQEINQSINQWLITKKNIKNSSASSDTSSGNVVMQSCIGNVQNLHNHN